MLKKISQIPLYHAPSAKVPKLEKSVFRQEGEMRERHHSISVRIEDAGINGRGRLKMNSYRIQNVYSKSSYKKLYPDDMIDMGTFHIAPAIESEFSFESSKGDWWYVWLQKGTEEVPFQEGDVLNGRVVLDVYFFQNRKKGCVLLKPL